MNWKELKKKYPKAWAQMVNGEIPVNDPRDLYDFFDDNEIYPTVRKVVGKDEYFGTTEINGKRASTTECYKIRIKTEKVLFNHSFELLENKLK